MTPTDFHTHRLDAGPDAITSIDPVRALTFITADNSIPVSIGIHPWDTVQEPDFDLIEQIAAMTQVVAIGETGLDKLRGAPLTRQTDIFRRHIELSERLGKPLIIHCVKAWEELLRLKKEMKPQQNWGIHGFRGGPEQALQLTASGLYLSLGCHFNPYTAAAIPADRLLAETDESSLPIATIASRIAAVRRDDWNPGATLARFLSK